MMPRYLTVEQRVDFRARHRRLLRGIAVALVYSSSVVLIDKFVSLEPYGFAITVGGFIVVIFVLYCMFRYHCPVCKKAPKARMWSFSGTDVAYSSMLALFPKTCSECGVHLKLEEKIPPDV
jgi:hypothetical protein